MKRRRRGKRKTKRTGTPRGGRAEHRGGTEFEAHVKLARKLVKKIRKKVAALGRRRKTRRKRGN